MAGSILDDIEIAAPCNVSWDSMQGDERVRHCGSCSKNVYNISAMTKAEAEAFLQKNGTSQCLRLFRRKDGTIITDNCPVGLRKLRDRYRKVASLITSAAAAAIALLPISLPTMARETIRTMGRSFHGTNYHPEWAMGGPRPIVQQQPQQTEPHVEIWNAPPAEPQTVPKPELPRTGAADTAALELYNQAWKSETQGKFFLAKIQYQDALQAAESNKGSDPKFMGTIKNALQRIDRKLELR